jgi:hypothetical protein
MRIEQFHLLLDPQDADSVLEGQEYLQY